MVWGSFIIVTAVLKTPTRDGYNAYGANLTICASSAKAPSASSSLVCSVIRAKSGVHMYIDVYIYVYVGVCTYIYIRTFREGT